MLLGNDLVRDRLAQKISNYLRSKMSEPKQENQPKKGRKKGKKRKIRKVKQTTTSSVNAWMLVSVDDFLERVKEIAARRYSFPSESIRKYSDLLFLQTAKSKLSFLREVARGFGLSFERKNYAFAPGEEDFEYPLKVKNISNYYPLVKGVRFGLDCLQYNQNTFEQLMQRKKYEDALNVLRSSQNMILNAFGIYHEEFVKVCKNIALVKFLQKKHDEAVSVQLFAVKLCQKLFGLDNKHTAIAILELSNYLYDKKAFRQSLYYHSLALYIFDIVASEYNPNSLLCLHELQIMAYAQKDFPLSTQFMQELLKRNEEMHGEASERLLYFLEKLAQLQSLQKDFEQASLLQARHYLIMNRSFKKIEHQLNPQQLQNMKNKLRESDNLKKYYVKQRNSKRSRAQQ
jgi:hypothetical protein